MSQVPFSPHMMGHMDEQGRKKLQGSKISGFYNLQTCTPSETSLLCEIFCVVCFTYLFNPVAAEAQKMEKVSLQHINDLIRRVEEVLGLWRILVDHQLHIIVSTLSKVQYLQDSILPPPPLSFKKKMKIITILLNVTFFCVGPTESAERNEF